MSDETNKLDAPYDDVSQAGNWKEAFDALTRVHQQFSLKYGTLIDLLDEISRELEEGDHADVIVRRIELIMAKRATCECVQCCDGEHAGSCKECAGWGDRSTEEITGICNSCNGTGICPRCNGVN
jgi:hypothetical protein